MRFLCVSHVGGGIPFTPDPLAQTDRLLRNPSFKNGRKMETSQDFCSFIVFLTENISFKNGSILSLQSFQLGHRHVTQTIRKYALIWLQRKNELD